MVTLTVQALMVDNKGRAEYHLTVKTYNPRTEEWTPIWSIVKEEPFEAQIEVGMLTQLHTEKRAYQCK